jgi:hypothetical protein
MLFEPQFRIARAVQRAIAQIQKTLQTLVESIDEQQQTERARDEQKPVHADVGLPIEISEYYRSEQTERPEKNFRERLRMSLEIAGVILAAALALLTLFTLRVFRKQLWEAQNQTAVFRQQADQAKQDAAAQLSVAKDALTAEQERFVNEQRPYVWSGITEPNQPAMAPDQPVYWNWHYTNYGKTPAVGAAGREQVIWGTHARSQLKKTFFDPIHKPSDKSGVVIPPNKDMYSSAHTINNNPTAADIQWIKANNSGVMMIAYWEYFDTSGNLYKSTICLERLASGAVADCGTFTKIE